jgi:hypothetical protein
MTEVVQIIKIMDNPKIGKYLLHSTLKITLLLLDKHRSRVSERRMLRNIIGFKRWRETGGWSKLHNKEL